MELVLTFPHLIELRMVRLFRHHGVSMPVIRAAAIRAAQLLGADHPFSSLKLRTDGKSIFAELSPDQVYEQWDGAQKDERLDENKIIEDLKRLQIVMGPIIETYFKDLDYADDMASRWWLLGRDKRAVLDPWRNFGQPSHHDSGVPLSVLYKLINAGETVAAVADWYEVDEGAVTTAIEFYESFSTEDYRVRN